MEALKIPLFPAAPHGEVNRFNPGVQTPLRNLL